MKIREYANQLLARHTTGGLYLDAHEVRNCAVSAVQEMAGWCLLEDPAWNGTLDGVTAETDVSPSEWGVIGPMFSLLVEYGNAMRLESCAGLGMPSPPRSSSECAQAIEAMRQELPNKAFSAAPFSVGFPDGY
jgi:hypothetical protein